MRFLLLREIKLERDRDIRKNNVGKEKSLRLKIQVLLLENTGIGETTLDIGVIYEG